MSFVKILNIDVVFMKNTLRREFANEVRHDIEAKVNSLPDREEMPYKKADIIELINTIEVCKIRFLKGETSAKRMYRDVDFALSLFRIKHPGFDYLNDALLNAYFT